VKTEGFFFEYYYYKIAFCKAINLQKYLMLEKKITECIKRLYSVLKSINEAITEILLKSY